MIKILYEDDEWIEFELTQQNDLVGETKDWTEEDWTYWKIKMDELEKNGTRGQLETLKIKLKKNPFIDGTNFFGTVNGVKEHTGENGSFEQYSNSTTEHKFIDGQRSEDTQGPKIQPE